MKFITLEEARLQCRADGNDDSLVEVYANAAEDYAMKFLDRPVFASQVELDEAIADGSAGEHAMVLSQNTKSAILLITGLLYKNREGEVEMPQTIHALLWPDRRGWGI